MSSLRAALIFGGWVWVAVAPALAQQSLFPTKRVQPWWTTTPNHTYYYNSQYFVEQSGWQDLWTRCNGYLPRGSNVRVAQAENALVDTNLFPDKVFWFVPGSIMSTNAGGHENTVATMYYATNYSSDAQGIFEFGFAPGIRYVNSYTTDDLALNVLQVASDGTRTGQMPSWGAGVREDVLNISNTFGNGSEANKLRALDYLLDTANTFACTAQPGSYDSAVTGSATLWNAVVVGKTSPDTSYFAGTPYEDVNGYPRPKPDLVAASYISSDGAASSWATPTVASGAAMLLERARATAGTLAATNNYVLKAILMAGATKYGLYPGQFDQTGTITNVDYTRSYYWSNNPPAEPLNRQTGVGALNVNYSYGILEAGNGATGPCGWVWGQGVSTTNTQSWTFSLPYNESEFTATLVWNRHVQDNSGTSYNWSVADLRLDLFDGGGTLLASSDNPGNNVEHIYLREGLTAGSYRLQVSSHTAAPENYGLAWRGARPGGAALVRRAGAWKFLDSGVYPGTNWYKRSFSDTNWATGTAPLGYGQDYNFLLADSPATVPSYGTNAANKYITTWFRRAFIVASTNGMTNLLCQVRRADGVVVYLNDQEVLRNSMPTGTVKSNTLASANVYYGYWVNTNLSPSRLVVGTNVIAAEVHLSSASASDMIFDLSLLAQTVPVTATNPPPVIVLSSPANGAGYAAPATIPLTASVTPNGNLIDKVQFLSGTNLLAEAFSAPFAFSWANVSTGAYTLKTKAFYNTTASVTSAIVNVTVTNPPPTIALTSPSDGARFDSPATIPLAAFITTNGNSISVSKVQFFSDTNLLGEDLTAPYTFSWTNVGMGTYSLKARATYNTTNTIDSPLVTISVTHVPPLITLNSPANRQVFAFTDVIPVVATASSPEGAIARVEFYDGAGLLASITNSPYNFSWSNASAGAHVLTARAVDTFALSTSVSATVGVAAVTGPICWSGGGENNNWTEPFNWSLFRAPNNGEALMFAGPNRLNSTNNCLSLAGAVTLTNSGFVLSGIPLTLNGGLASFGANTWAIDSALGAAQTFTSASGLLTVAGNVANAGFDLTCDGDGDTLLSRSLSGGGGLNKNGAGRLTLPGANILYTGATTINDGSLSLQDTTGFVSPTSVGAGASLNVGLSAVGFANRTKLTGLISGAGTLTVSNGTPGIGGGWLVFRGAAIGLSALTGTVNIYSGVLSMENLTGAWSGNPTLHLTDTGLFAIRGQNISVDALTGDGDVFNCWNGHGTAGDTLTVGANNGSGVFLGAIHGSISSGGTDGALEQGIVNLVKAGAGTQTLAGDSTYTGTTTVNGGTLMVNGSLASPVTTVAGGTLAGTGTMAGATTVQGGGMLAPGAPGIGTLTINNALRLLGASAMSLNRTNTPNASRVAGISTLTAGGTLAVTNLGPALQDGDTFQLFVAANYAGNFGAVVLPAFTNGLGWDLTALKTSGTIRVAVLPSIVTPPQDTIVSNGAPVLFTVAAAGTAPLAYQWRKGGAGLLGATNTSYTIPAASASDVAGYDVMVTNVAGAVTSSVASLTLYAPPAFTRQPTNQTIVGGGEADFTVAASGVPSPAFQWFFNTNLLAGQTSATLTLTNAQGTNAGSYYALAMNSVGVRTSEVATLTVVLPPLITNQPLSRIVTNGDPAGFSVGADGLGLTYQWRKDGDSLPGATDTFYTIPAASTNDVAGYDVIVANLAGARTSVVATLTVYLPPEFTLQPTNQAVVAGAQALFAVFASGVPSPAYQWYFDTNLLAGETSATLSVTNAQLTNAGSYYALAVNSAGVRTSEVATLTVYVPPEFTLQPTNQTVDAGSPALFTVAASGVPSPAFQWFFNTNLLAGETSATLSVTNAQATNAGPYFALAINAAGVCTSEVATLTVVLPPAVTNQPPTLSSYSLGPDGSFTLGGTGPAGQTYILQGTADLTPPLTWVALATNQADTNGVFVLTDLGAAQCPQRFYRTVTP